MSTAGTTTGWIERGSDLLNPILVKETRQALKSRQFLITFVLLLAGSWVVSTFGMLGAGDAIEFGSTGRQFFFAYYVVLAVATFIIVPFSAYRSLLNERDENTFELLSITALSPRQIVWGKLFSALVQLFIYYSAIAPFIAFTSLLQGFDVAQVSFLLVISLLISLAASMAALMFATLARQKQWQAMNSLVLLGGLLWLFGGCIALAGEILDSPMPFDDPDFWWGMGFMLAIGVSYLVLVQQVTTAQLTFESGNRSSGVRVTTSVQFVLIWAGLIAYHLYKVTLLDDDVVMVLSIFVALHLAAIGLFAATEDNFLSRRVRRDLPKDLIRRALYTPYMPGGSRGFLFVVLHLLAQLVVIVNVTQFWTTTSFGRDVTSFCIALNCYVIIYLGLGTALLRWGRIVSSEFKPAHARVLTLLIFAAGAIVPYLPSMISSQGYRGFHLMLITNPFASLTEMGRPTPNTDKILTLVLIGAAISILVNGRAMWQGVTEIISAKATPIRKTQPSQPMEITTAAEQA